MENRFKLQSEVYLPSQKAQNEKEHINVYHALAKVKNKKLDLESHPPHELDTILWQTLFET